jgi:hypothetical protein
MAVLDYSLYFSNNYLLQQLKNVTETSPSRTPLSAYFKNCAFSLRILWVTEVTVKFLGTKVPCTLG